MELCVTLAPLAVKLVIEETVPKETAPPVPPVSVKVWAPVIVPVNAMFPPAGAPFVVSATTLTPREMGPVNVMLPPLDVKLPPKLIAVVPV